MYCENVIDFTIDNNVYMYSYLTKLLGFDGITVETIVKSYWQNCQKSKLYTGSLDNLD